MGTNKAHNYQNLMHLNAFSPKDSFLRFQSYFEDLMIRHDCLVWQQKFSDFKIKLCININSATFGDPVEKEVAVKEVFLG